MYEVVKAELEAEDKNFTEAVIFGLQHSLKNGTANIEHIYCDMWSGIAIKYVPFKALQKCEEVDECVCQEDCEEELKHVKDFWIECDRIHHGLARAYQLVKQFDADLVQR